MPPEDADFAKWRPGQINRAADTCSGKGLIIGNPNEPERGDNCLATCNSNRIKSNQPTDDDDDDDAAQPPLFFVVHLLLFLVLDDFFQLAAAGSTAARGVFVVDDDDIGIRRSVSCALAIDSSLLCARARVLLSLPVPVSLTN